MIAWVGDHNHEVEAKPAVKGMCLNVYMVYMMFTVIQILCVEPEGWTFFSLLYNNFTIGMTLDNSYRYSSLTF